MRLYNILKEYNLSVVEWIILKKYVDHYFEDDTTILINDLVSERLWNKGYLVKDVGGYYFNSFNIYTIEAIMAKKELTQEQLDRLLPLACKMAKYFPEGKKPGTIHKWRSNPTVVADRLATFLNKFKHCDEDGIREYTDEEILDATRRYVESFHGDYSYMKVLMYMIYKHETQGTMSQLADFLEDIEEDNSSFNLDSNWIQELM